MSRDRSLGWAMIVMALVFGALILGLQARIRGLAYTLSTDDAAIMAVTKAYDGRILISSVNVAADESEWTAETIIIVDGSAKTLAFYVARCDEGKILKDGRAYFRGCRGTHKNGLPYFGVEP